MELKTIKGVEIFRAGTWRGDTYTIKDLDEMVENFKKWSKVWFRPAVKFGHGNTPGQEAAGYLDNVRREGDKLVADLVDVPPEIYAAIKARRYDRVSVEIVKNFEREGQQGRNLLWSLALLGVEVPEVSGLKPLHALALSAGESPTAYTTQLGIQRFAVWTTDYINNLPDAAFAVIEPGGEKDDEGKTVPRALRHLPHHTSGVKDPDDNDTVDLAHLRNALARAPQMSIPKELIERAIRHLEKHAKALGIGEAAAETEKESAQPQEVKQMEKEYDKNIEAMQAMIDEAAKKMAAMQAELDAAKKQAADLERKQYEAEVARKVDGVTIPALREYIRALYLIGSNSVVKFSADGKNAVDTPITTVIDSLVAKVNEIGKSLLTQHSVQASLEPPADDPRAEVSRRVAKLISENPKMTYAEAAAKVFAADPALKEAYVRS